MSYRDLEIRRLADELVVDVHRMTLQKLRKFEFCEQGSQIRRSMKSVKANIVEGYGRRRYKQEFIKALTCAHGSCDETTDHLETLFRTGSLTDELLYREIHDFLLVLGRKLHAFIIAVERGRRSEK